MFHLLPHVVSANQRWIFNALCNNGLKKDKLPYPRPKWRVRTGFHTRIRVASYRPWYAGHSAVSGEMGGYIDGIDDKKSKSLNVNEVPLKEEDQKSWLEFKKLDEGKPVLSMINEEIANKVKVPIKVDHPFVRVVGDFAIGAYNELYQMHVKKGEYNNLRHHEVIECKYLHLFRDYCFYMTIEAIEEGILGVYETIVVCDPRDGRRTLIKFFLTYGKPTGKISMMLPHLVCLKSKYKTMKGMKKDLKIKLETTDTFMKGMNKGKVTAQLIRLKEQHKAMKGVCNVLYRNIRLQIPTNWNERSNPDGWCAPNYRTSGLRKRCNDATCKGYNYRTPEFTQDTRCMW